MNAQVYPLHADRRKRRAYGAFPLGEARLIVANPRQQLGDGLGVLVGAGAWRSEQCLITPRSAPLQARVMAHALLEAAAAFEAVQRQPQFTRAGGDSTERNFAFSSGGGVRLVGAGKVIDAAAARGQEWGAA